MKQLKIFIVFALLFIISNDFLSAQSIIGYVYDENNVPLPFVNIYVKHTELGTTTDEKGRYYLKLEDGDYEIVFSTIGYDTKVLPVVVQRGENVKNIWLSSSVTQISEIEVQAKRRDPAYDIIQNAIDAKDKNSRQAQSYKCEVYIKAKEVITEKERKKREEKAAKDTLMTDNVEDDEFEKDPALIETEKLNQQKYERMRLANSMNMAEIKLELNYQYPDNVKEIRNGFEKYGNTEDLFFLSTTEAKFDFYQNLLNIGNLSEIPFVSPLNVSSVLSYKFKLEGTWFENDMMIYHIKVTPRTKGNSTFEGYIDIIFGSYAIRRIDLSVLPGSLILYDNFRIQQEYELFNDSVWLVKRQEFDYTTKENRTQFTGNTVVSYDNFELNVDYSKRYFNNELAVTAQEAYERDSSYWEKIRPQPLTPDEQKIIFIKDSIEAAQNTKQYLDSIDNAYNKVTLGDIGLWGFGFFNREKQQHIWITSLSGLANPFAIGGLRIGPYLMYYKKFKNHTGLLTYLNANYGIRNEDIKGSFYIDYTYNPIKLSKFSVGIGRNFDMVQPNESFTGLIDRSNYIEAIYLSLGHSTEIINGIYFNLSFDLREHRSIADYKFGTITDDWVENNIPRDFEPYKLFSGKAEFKFIPFQKYMSEPYEKVVLGSKWPTFSLSYNKGIPKVFSSEINFDFVEASIIQDIKVRTYGTSTIKLGSGKFLNTTKMFYENYKIFPRGDNWFFSTPMQNQLQDSTIYTTDWYIELHGVHHFNGAFGSNIPLVKKLKIFTITGFNYTWIKESNYHYFDYYFGIERTFKIQRQRFRLGVFFVYGGSNNTKARPTIQFAINHYDKREKSWDY